MSKVVALMQGYNEADMIPYSMGSIYNEVDRILFVEGAVEGRFDSYRSTDNTIDVIKSIDVDNKCIIIQIDRFWKDLEEMKNSFIPHLNHGDWMAILDSDEVMMEGDITKLRTIIDTRPQYTEYIGLFHEFYGDFLHIMRPNPGYVNVTIQRFVQYRSGYNWRNHPTLNNSQGVDTSINPAYEDERILIPDFSYYHLSWTKPKDYMIDKHMYYFSKFDSMPEPAARARAEKHVADSGSDLLSYDGPLPQVLSNHPLYGKDVVGGDWPHYLSTLEYRHPERIESPYNIKWVAPSKVSVIITCYDNLDILKITLPRWKHQSYSNHEVIVVEDGRPSANTVTGIQDYVESLGYTYRYNDSGDKYCIASARNIGIWAATGDRIIFTDSDMLVDRYFITEHMMEATPDNITVGCRYHIPQGKWTSESLESGKYTILDSEELLRRVDDHWGAVEEGDIFIEVHTDNGDKYITIEGDPREENAFPLITSGRSVAPWEDCHGCNLSMHRKHLIAINGLDEEYDGAWGGEDIDLAYRLIRKGLAVVPVPKSVGYHIDHPSRERAGQRAKLNSKMQEDIVRAKPKSWG